MFAVLAIGNAGANQDYLVSNLRISRVDRDATTARKNAMAEGQRDAFYTILRRLGVDTSNGILVSNDEISEMIISMQIKNERITNNSYSAVLNIEFNPEYINYTLNKHKINEYSPKLDSYLIVPVLNENGKTYLWEKGNRWMPAFRKSLADENSIFIVSNDYSTKNLVDLEDFNRPSYSKFKNLANLYNVNNIVLVIGNYTKGSAIIDTKIYVLNAEKTRNAALNYEMLTPNSPAVGFEDAAIKVIDYIKSLLEKENEEQMAEVEGTKLKLLKDGAYVFLPISSVGDFNYSDKLLRGNQNITSIELKMVSKNMALYLVKFYNNDLKSFIYSLKADGFSVSEKREGIYIFI